MTKLQIKFEIEIKPNEIIQQNLKLIGYLEGVTSKFEIKVPTTQVTTRVHLETEKFYKKIGFVNPSDHDSDSDPDPEMDMVKFKRCLKVSMGFSPFWSPNDQLEEVNFSRNFLFTLFLITLFQLDDQFVETLPFNEDSPCQNLHSAQMVHEIGDYIANSMRHGFKNEPQLDEEKYQNFKWLPKCVLFLKEFYEICKLKIKNFEENKFPWITELERTFGGASKSFNYEKNMDEMEFKQIRSEMSGVGACFEFGLLLQGIALNDELRGDVVFQKLLMTIENLVTFTNDILGLGREIQINERMNLVIFKWKKGDSGGDIQNCLDKACHFVNGETVVFEETSRSLISLYPNSVDIQRMVDYAQNFINGGYHAYKYLDKIYQLSKIEII